MPLEGYGGRALLLLIFSLYNCNIITSVNTDNMSVTITTTCREKAMMNLAQMAQMAQMARHVIYIIIIITN